eukprot:gene39511-48106_t
MYLRQKVVTPYGVGRIVALREKDVVVQPLDWKLADGRTPTFYMNPKDVKASLLVSDPVETTFGTGTIIDFDGNRNIYTVVLNNWTLANGKSPTLYLNDDSLKKIINSSAQKSELILTKVSKLKEEAKEAYVLRKFEEAKVKYTIAMQTLQTIGDDLNGLQRARFLDMCVTCHSNISLCAWNTSSLADCVVYASNTINLIDAILSKVPESELWRNMVVLGYTVDKLADMKIKALRIKGKAEDKKGDYDDAKKSLEAALKLSCNEKTTKELDDLLLTVVKKKNSEKKKEKALWKKAFDKRDADTSDDLDKPQATLSPTKKASVASAGSKKQKEIKVSKPVVEDVSTYSASSLFYPILGLGFLGLLTGAAFWWLKRRNTK